MQDELLNREIFYTLLEAKALIERWRREYNQIRPHSSSAIVPRPGLRSLCRQNQVPGGLVIIMLWTKNHALFD